MRNPVCKKVGLWVLAAVLWMMPVGAVQAQEMMELDGNSSQRVYDMAELLDEEEEAEFESVIAGQRKKLRP